MKIEQLYTNCLAHAAYFVESDGEAAIFDPLRDTDMYLELAQKNNTQIKYVFETHFHADFVSGHLDLAKHTGAFIVYGPGAAPKFDAIIATDGQCFQLGKAMIKAIHTPGHTMESTVYLLIDEEGKETGLITGDTLFIGDVGRPDLVQLLNSERTPEKLASLLYHSLRNKIMPLQDDIIIYPNHGAGSACGKNMSKVTIDTLGHQKKVNYALNPSLTEAEFTRLILTGLSKAPAYFPDNVLMNINGYTDYNDLMVRNNHPLSVQEFEAIRNEKQILIVDTRTSEEFAKGFIPNSLHIGLNGNFAQWAGELIKHVDQEIVLVTEIGKEKESITRLARIGFDHVLGYVEGGFAAWQEAHKPSSSVERISAKQLMEKIQLGTETIIDVRSCMEFESYHVPNSISIPLQRIEAELDKIPSSNPFQIICAGGYRSMIAASILKRNNIHHFVDVIGGMDAVKKLELSTEKIIEVQ